MNYEPNEHGYWGEYGGRFVPETLVAPLDELTTGYFAVRDDAGFSGGVSRSAAKLCRAGRRRFILQNG